MRNLSARILAIASVLGAGAILGACTESRLRDDPHFSETTRQDIAAQIADPDAHYAGTPAPAANGLRSDAAQERYVRGQVIQPPSTETSEVVSGGNAPSGGGGAPAPSAGQ